MRVRQPVPAPTLRAAPASRRRRRFSTERPLGKFVAARLTEHYLELQQLRDEVREAEAAKKQRPSRTVHLTRR
jgi:hypothetical protein